MNTVLACVDGGAQTEGVCDYAQWAAKRLSAPLEFLNVIDHRPEQALIADLSGTISLGVQESLLEELARLDEQRNKIALAHGREVLEAARIRARDAGIAHAQTTQMHGVLPDILQKMEEQIRLLVIGQHPVEGNVPRLHLDENVERIVRVLKKPVLVATREFRDVKHCAIAFDGSATGRHMLELLAASPFLAGLICHVITIGEDTPAVHALLEWAQTTLEAASFVVHTHHYTGNADAVLRSAITEHSVDLLVMGAYGNSRIREFIVGSTTTTLLRTSPVPVLILR